jgi:hypothetical protein
LASARIAGTQNENFFHKGRWLKKCRTKVACRTQYLGLVASSFRQATIYNKKFHACQTIFLSNDLTLPAIIPSVGKPRRQQPARWVFVSLKVIHLFRLLRNI